MNQLFTRAFIGLAVCGGIALTSCNNNDPEPAGNMWQRTMNYPGGYNTDAPVFTIGTKGYVVDTHFWEFDQTSGAWTKKTDFPLSTESDENAFSFSIDGKGYVGTGGITIYSKDVFRYDPATDSWTKMNSFPSTARYGTSSFAIGDKGYVIGGDDHTITTSDSPNLALDEVWEYTPATDSWKQKAPFPGGGRVGAVAFSINGKGYMATGRYTKRVNGLSSTVIVKDFWEYDPASDKWTQKAELPAGERYEAVGFSLNGKGYLGTGFLGPNEIYKDFWEYNPSTDKWTQKADIGIHTRYSAFGFGLGDKGYVGGGTSSNAEYEQETKSTYFWEYVSK